MSFSLSLLPQASSHLSSGFTSTRTGLCAEDGKCAVSALRFLAHNSDVWIARSTRFALHDLFVEDSWRLFTRNRDAMAQVRSDYEEVVTGTVYQVAAAGTPATPRTSVPPEIALVQENDGDADSLESF